MKQDEHVEAPRAVGHVHQKAEREPCDGAQLPPVPEAEPGHVQQHGVGERAPEQQPAQQQPLQCDDCDSGEQVTT